VRIQVVRSGLKAMAFGAFFVSLQEPALAANGQNMPASVWAAWTLGPVASVLALAFSFHFFKSMMRQDEGTDVMRRIAGFVREGAGAYLRQQYKVVALFFLAMVIVLGFMAFVMGVQSPWVPFAFLTGGFFSGLAGFLGMKTATYASARTASAARSSLNRALQLAFRSGAVMGLTVVGLALLDICAWFFVLYFLVPRIPFFKPLSLFEITVTMLSFGMGASSQALFARVGGGIYTKAADVGADLVGKVEAGIPEDDPRNPATIADNVGDNVGDVAGMGADLYESYAGSILSTCVLGVAAAATLSVGQLANLGGTPIEAQLRLLITPVALAGIGTLLSILGIYAVRSGEQATQRQLLSALGRGVNLSSLLILILSFFLVRFMLPGMTGVWGAILVGLLAGIGIGKSTEYFTSEEYRPTLAIANQSRTGPATVIIEGMANGMLSTIPPVVFVVVAILLAYGLPGGFTNPAMGLYGVGIAAVGLLSTLGITLATDAYGPIADNAGGNAEMSGLEPYVRERTDALDSLGNTTAATGKGFAIGSAALTALALLAAYIEEVRIGVERVAAKASGVLGEMVPLGHGLWARITESGSEAFIQVGGQKIAATKATIGDFMAFYDINLMNPKVLGGVLIGSMMAFAFCAFTMKAVGRAASRMVEEVRRQFRDKPGIMEGKETPDYMSCVQISTAGAQREMVLPSLMALIIPVVIGVMLGVAGVVGLLVAGLSTGFVLAVMMANAGGSWDNAKKYIEKGHLGGKGSDCHKAGVVGDTVGDPFKDTSGPSLNIMIKLMSMVSVVFAGLTVKMGPILAKLLHM